MCRSNYFSIVYGTNAHYVSLTVCVATNVAIITLREARKVWKIVLLTTLHPYSHRIMTSSLNILIEIRSQLVGYGTNGTMELLL